MPADNSRLEIRCPKCAWHLAVDVAGAARFLQDGGLLGRTAPPEPALVWELLRGTAGRLPCGACRAVGIVLAPADETNWGDARKCRQCHERLSAERLEAFPDATLCTACQARQEAGEPEGEPEFCERCGGLMKIVPHSRYGAAQYSWRCSECGR